MLLLLIAAIVTLLLWVGLTVFNNGMDAGNHVAGIASAIFAATALYLQVRSSQSQSQTRPDATDTDIRVESTARVLALRVQEISQQEERNWRIGDPWALRVRWRTASDDVVDHWEKIQAFTADGGDRPLPLTGDLPGVHSLYQSVPTGRLVIIGRAGAGKTVLAHRLILECFNHPGDSLRVPVLFSLGSWDPSRTGLHDWLADRLIGDYAFLEGVDSTGTPLARVLLESGRILPVLDGFDEIQQHHHGAAISELSRFDGPLILTTRPDEYAAAVSATRALSRAAAIELEDLALDDVQRYLQAVSGKTRTAQWESVFSHVRTRPDDVVSRNLAAALSTPLLVMLTRTIYNETPHQNPTDLLDGGRFPTQDALEEHLFSAYLTALYDPRRTVRSGAGRATWTDHQARHWLGHLADHLARLNTQDLTWWRLDATLRRRTRVLVTGLVAMLVGGIVGVLSYVVANRLSGAPVGGAQFREGLLEMGTGLVAGLAAGLLNETRTRRGGTGRNPERLRLGPSRQPLPARSRVLRGIGVELVIGLSAALLFSLASWLIWGVADDDPSNSSARNFVWAFAPWLHITGTAIYVAAGLILGFLVGISYAFVNAVVCVFSGPNDRNSAVSPWDLLSMDRGVTLFRVGMVGFAVLLMNFVLVGNQYGDFPSAAFLRQGLLYGLLYGSFAALTRLVLSAWGGWLLFARLWLPLCGRLPWRPKLFLDDAYARGVLRQSGAVYQFRHVRLRDHLVDQHRTEGRGVPEEPAAPRTTNDHVAEQEAPEQV
ncbi:NACHT domain-containing protein [Nonomuraea harbinensis]|uniref:NACHT domain-containing protein n=1 Tax=Nonomuraea harbinensis TaxID=1286938 RepID=A0ABW1CBF7_9ACTN|nr:NACHT domain-containing protein [Nonomuraea harbinensis]